MNLLHKFKHYITNIISSKKALKNCDTKSNSEYDEDNIIKNIGEFKDSKISEIMVPRSEVIAVKCDVNLEQLSRKFTETSFDKMLVYKGTLDFFVGFVHVTDLIKYLYDKSEFCLEKLLCKPLYVPKSIKSFELLRKMKKSKIYMAVVLDEYGGSEGIISVEHLIKEMVGEISSESENNDSILIKKINNNTYIINARTSVFDVEDAIGIDSLFSESRGEYETIGGFILSYLDRVPEKGEKFFPTSNISFEIINADARRVKSIKLVTNMS